MPPPPLIVLVEDDAQIRRVVEGYLEQEGYRVLVARDGEGGLALIERELPTVAILDIMLPGISGLDIVRRVRASADTAVAATYVIMLTARVEETDRVRGLELGADDYVTKPFSPRELTARVRAAVRRLAVQPPEASAPVLQAGALALDPTYRAATLDGMPVDLTAVEFDLLHYLMLHPGRPFTRSQLLDVTQADPSDVDPAYERTIDAHVKNIRRKLGDAGRNSRYIETVHGVGYRFAPQEAQP